MKEQGKKVEEAMENFAKAFAQLMIVGIIS